LLGTKRSPWTSSGKVRANPGFVGKAPLSVGFAFQQSLGARGLGSVPRVV
jgi:hypothetical protein